MLGIDYPNFSDKNVVQLTCQRFGSNVTETEVIFERYNESINIVTTDDNFNAIEGGEDGQELSEVNGLSIISNPTNGSIVFSFSQDQEGWFTCKKPDDISNAVALAGCYNYNVITVLCIILLYMLHAEPLVKNGGGGRWLII